METKSYGSTEIGIPLLIVAILGAVALPNFWGNLPFWGRVCAIWVIGVLAKIFKRETGFCQALLFVCGGMNSFFVLTGLVVARER